MCIPTIWTALLDFLQEWVLSDRTRFVFMNNALSDFGLVKAGVSQLAVLGPYCSYYISMTLQIT